MRYLLPLLAILVLPAPALANAGEAVADEMVRRFGGSLPEGELRVRLDQEGPADIIGVETLRYDPRSGRVAAILVAAEGRFAVEGSAWTEIEAAVPNRRLTPGEIIQPGDLASLPVRADQVSARAVVAPTDLIGKQVRRALVPGRLVQSGSVGEPVVVERSKPVTLEFRSGALLLTARGRALESGGVGDVVRVINLDSNRTITGVVSGPGVVSASP
ncbi:flagellar basal body P-ring formation chaperone FlgA [Rhodospirillum centenum]|uniref:Flagella basal body P-ring formation protein FlgA n=1 Tax=Rhodospirillum centenum (strain ATCC 51521 / SW) TaxID=414684 RepID=B6IQD2_RHOCS|nr:flagellar basal body P-ring formation chaperone FlgA [Rhodospirillum centenum]ACI97668.1 flagella basal body P-ring formation protein FlgA, putative [Rhodospirillum centenum SW]